jgi:hypothetical protein
LADAKESDISLLIFDTLFDKRTDSRTEIFALMITTI